MPEEKDVQEGSSPSLEDVVAESSPAQEAAQEAQEAQTPTAEEGETQEAQEQETEAPLHEHPRFKEVIEEKNWYKQQLEQMMQRQPPQQQPQKPEEAQLGSTPDEREFWGLVKEVGRKEAERIINERISPQLEAGAKEFARMAVSQFRRDHTDIEPNSPEEQEIAQKIRQFNYSPDDAYWAVMGPRGIKVAENQAVRKVQQKITAKKQANVENRSLPANAPSPPSGKQSQLEEIEENMRKIEAGEV